jgi:hypothetical protein
LKKNKKKACGMAMDETGIIASAGAILGASEETAIGEQEKRTMMVLQKASFVKAVTTVGYCGMDNGGGLVTAAPCQHSTQPNRQLFEQRLRGIAARMDKLQHEVFFYFLNQKAIQILCFSKKIPI